MTGPSLTGAARTVKAPVLRATGVPMAMAEITVLPPGPGQVMVRLAASGVCHSCLHSIDGSLAGTPMPIILGDEGAGVVDQVGPGVTGLAPGDHVVLSWAPSCEACRECLRGHPARCRDKPEFGYLPDGASYFRAGDETVFHYGPATSSPYTVVPATGAIKVSESVPLKLAALVGCSVTTGAGAVLRTAAVRAGQSVAVVGCGGVGLNAVLAAHLAGASPVVAVDPVQLKLDAAREFGVYLTDPADAATAITWYRTQLGPTAPLSILLRPGPPTPAPSPHPPTLSPPPPRAPAPLTLRAPIPPPPHLLRRPPHPPQPPSARKPSSPEPTTAPSSTSTPTASTASSP